MKRRQPVLIYVATLCALLLSGCTEIKLRLDVSKDLSARFAESLWFDLDTSQMFGTYQPPGSEDLWQQMRALAKAHGWVLKEKSANHMELSGSCKSNELCLSDLISGQLSAFAHGLGATAKSVSNNTTPLVTAHLANSPGFFNDDTSFDCSVDLRPLPLSSFLQLKPLFQQVVANPALQNTSDISLEMTVPGSVLCTNGKLQTGGKVIWPIKFGAANTVQLTWRHYHWHRIAGLIAVLLVIFSAALVLMLRRRRNAS